MQRSKKSHGRLVVAFLSVGQWLPTWGARNYSRGVQEMSILMTRNLSIYSASGFSFVFLHYVVLSFPYVCILLHNKIFKYVVDCLKTGSLSYYFAHIISEIFYFCKVYSNINL